MKPAVPQSPQRGDRTDRRAELLLGALSAAVLLLIAFMIVFVFTKAWPSFAHNGLAWFGPGGNVGVQLAAIFNSPADPEDYVYELHAWP
ncbi:MAG: ABC transporter permease, partial [Solirubrobacterales bacterium]